MQDYGKEKYKWWNVRNFKCSFVISKLYKRWLDINPTIIFYNLHSSILYRTSIQNLLSIYVYIKFYCLITFLNSWPKFIHLLLFPRLDCKMHTYLKTVSFFHTQPWKNLIMFILIMQRKFWTWKIIVPEFKEDSFPFK